MHRKLFAVAFASLAATAAAQKPSATDVNKASNPLTSAITVNLGFNKAWLSLGGTNVNLFAELQWTVAHSGVGQPKLQAFGGVDLQSPLGKK